MIPGDGILDGKGKGCLLWFFVVSLALWTVYRLIYPRYDWHQKLTVTLETPDGEVSGNSVVGATVIFYPKILPEQSPVSNSWKGEAGVVELGGGRYLFALLGNPVYRARRAYWPQTPKGAKRVRSKTVYGKLDSWFGKPDPATLKPSNYPLLVTFGDINDPASVKRVDPDDLDAAFGLCPDGSGLKNRNAPWRAKKMSYKEWLVERARRGKEYKAMKSQSSYSGVALENILKRSYKPRNTSADCHRLKSITLEITSEPVTTGKVEEVLGWWLKMPRRSGGDVPALKLPNDSPRGWENLGALSFWSLDLLQKLKEKYQ